VAHPEGHGRPAQRAEDAGRTPAGQHRGRSAGSPAATAEALTVDGGTSKERISSRDEGEPRKEKDDAASTMGGISATFILHPIATSLLMVGILFVGIVAYPLLPVAPLPQVDFPTIQVSASLPGASPETMAAAVAQPLETQFAQIPG